MPEKVNNVLCVVAHPDDEALGVGGTLIRHAESGDNVFVVILSEGEEAKLPSKSRDPNRISCAEKWANFVGTDLYKVYDFPDQRLDVVPRLEIVQRLEGDISNIRPDIIYIHHPGDINLDHRIAAVSVLTAARPKSMTAMRLCPKILAFETPSSTDQAPQIGPFLFTPNFYVDVDLHWKKKMQALQFYRNELAPPPNPRSLESIEALAVKRGAEAGVSKAEAFMLIRQVV